MKNGHARAIIQDLQSYEQTQDSLALLKILAQGQENIGKRRFKPLKKAFADIRKHNVFVHAVLDGRRDLQSLLERRLLR